LNGDWCLIASEKGIFEYYLFVVKPLTIPNISIQGKILSIGIFGKYKADKNLLATFSTS